VRLKWEALAIPSTDYRADAPTVFTLATGIDKKSQFQMLRFEIEATPKH
jgi:hypothetical protein